MKSSKNNKGVKWAVWVPVIVAVITGVFLILNTIIGKPQTNKADSVQSVNEQVIDTGNINNYNAKGDININYGATKDTIFKPHVKNADKESSKSSNNKPRSTVTGDHNTVIQGDNNTVIEEN
jgi:hypothetical protein